MIKYGLILLVAIGFVACNTIHTNVQLNRINVSTFNESLSDSTKAQIVFDISLNGERYWSNDSAILLDSSFKKVYILQMLVKNLSNDTVWIDSKYSKITKGFDNEQNFFFDLNKKSWITLHNSEDKNRIIESIPLVFDSTICYYKTVLAPLNDSMKVRFYFQLSDFSKKPKWHDVYYTFKNDSFIIIRQTENEK
ncbi:MAG: hypothetical protein RL708_468 [Bacteroidota bacterium]